jgi:predicted ABC-type transport system involved in lysophospholipase L1 biosynthesis ATPase subunit
MVTHDDDLACRAQRIITIKDGEIEPIPPASLN